MTDVEGPLKLRHRFAIIRAAAKLGRAGQLTKGMDKQEAAALIAAQLMEDDPAAFEDPSIDWEYWIDLIIKMLPIILMLFGL